MKEQIIYEKKVKIELYNDHFENAKRYQIPRAQLIIADIPYNIGKMLMEVVLIGTLAEITKTVKARMQTVNFLIQTRILKYITSSNSVQGYLRRNLKKQKKHHA